MQTKIETEVSDTLEKMKQVKQLSDDIQRIDDIIQLADQPESYVAVHGADYYYKLANLDEIRLKDQIIMFYRLLRKKKMDEAEQLIKK